MLEEGNDGAVARDGWNDEIDDTEWVGARVRRRVGTVVELVRETVAVLEGAEEETFGTDVVVVVGE